jgi:hypothetical protein
LFVFLSFIHGILTGVKFWLFRFCGEIPRFLYTINEERQIWFAFSILEMLVWHFHRLLFYDERSTEPDRSFGAPRPKTSKPSLFWKTYSSACAKVRSGRKLENAKSARLKE